MSFNSWTKLSWLAVVAILSCDSPEVKQCREQYMEAYALVSAVDTTKLDSVEPALDKVSATLDICSKAQLPEEQKQLKTAKRKLESHQAYLRQQANLKKMTPEVLAQLIKKGDPNCPRGTAYKVNDDADQVRCTGPQILDMNWEQAKKYFERLAFKITTDGATFKAESGSVSYTYTFSKKDDTKAASCVVVFSPPGIPWEETASRISGVRPTRIKRDQPLPMKSGERKLKIEEQEIQAVLWVGECPPQ
jgi:hypothetical protein